MRPISDKTKQVLARDPFMKACCLCNSSTRKIEWHHNLIYAGRQVDHSLAILPLCSECHRNANDKLMKEELDWIMLVLRGLDVTYFPKSGLDKRRRYLIKKYGN